MYLVEITIPEHFRNEAVAVHGALSVSWPEASKLINRYLRAMAFKLKSKKFDFSDCVANDEKMTVTLEVNGDLWTGCLRKSRSLSELEDAIRKAESGH